MLHCDGNIHYTLHSLRITVHRNSKSCMELDDKEYPRVEYLARFNVHNIYTTYKRVDIGPP